MRDQFVRTAVISPKIRVADPAFNKAQIEAVMEQAAKDGARVVVFPELCLTGYTCGDLFLQASLQRAAMEALTELVEKSRSIPGIFFVGTPWQHKGRSYNCAAVFSGGELLGLVPKSFIPNYNEFYEVRHFAPGTEPLSTSFTDAAGLTYEVPLDTNLLFFCEEMPSLVLAAEICEDLWTADSPSTHHALAGATVVANLSASDELTGKAEYRRDLVRIQSGRTHCAYLYASAGEGESTQDLVFSGHCLVAENGTILAESKRFMSSVTYADIDLERLLMDRRRQNTWVEDDEDYEEIGFSLPVEKLELIRHFDPMPFVPHDKSQRDRRCEEIISIQAMGLKTRLEHIGCKRAVIGVSGGLDSTLALLVTARAFDLLGLDRAGILAVTMPCFGTTDRTYHNACRLAEALGATLKEVPIADAVLEHFKEIGHDVQVHDVTYENSQARERTQVLMDLANETNGIVIGTGDLSELALGWATYNGDHMSMYGVNASIPKTLVRHLVTYFADLAEREAVEDEPAAGVSDMAGEELAVDREESEELSVVLRDVLDTPVSPELLPPENGQIAQKTEDIVGPYELHDFFLYYVLRFGFEPAKIERMARNAFAGVYDHATIRKWLKSFYRRFFAQQFKRSCLPDGPKVGSVAVSPRGDLRMPSDASRRAWERGLEEI